MKNTRSAAAWFYGLPGIHGQAHETDAPYVIVHCEVCGAAMGRRDEVVPGVRRCDECRLRLALAERE